MFGEKPSAIAAQALRDKIAAHDAQRRERADVPAAAPSPYAEANREPEEAGAASAKSSRDSRALASALGTGFGRDETSYAQRVRFERASRSPVETIAIRYDRREHLVAMGVLPSPRYAQRTPEPFPGLRFVPAPY